MALTLSPEDFDQIRKIVRTELMTVPAPQGRPAQAAGASGVLVPFGRDKGKPIEDAETKDLEYIIGAQRRSIADASKAQYREKNEKVLMACEAELAKRGHAVQQPYRASPASSGSNLPWKTAADIGRDAPAENPGPDPSDVPF